MVQHTTVRRWTAHVLRLHLPRGSPETRLLEDEADRAGFERLSGGFVVGNGIAPDMDRVRLLLRLLEGAATGLPDPTVTYGRLGSGFDAVYHGPLHTFAAGVRS